MRTDVLIIGAGQAGLAMSQCLTARGIDHVVVERGRVGERWRSERWASLRLLTPNWMTRLPGHRPNDAEPDGFMGREEVVTLLDRYARGIAAPVVEGVAVTSVAAEAGGYRVDTDAGSWRARAVIVATGACDRSAVPAFADRLDPRILQVTPGRYRRAADLPDGGVLVVGGSSTGLQLARESSASGRPVTLSVGRHARMVRRYRGRDIFAWMDAAGVLDEPWTAVPHLAAARRAPSLQLSAEGAIDLATLAAQGVRVVGRLAGAEGLGVGTGGNLAADCAASDARLHRLLARIDDHIAGEGLSAPADPQAWKIPQHPVASAGRLDLGAEGIRTVVWATGFRRDYGWLRVPVVGRDGEIVHDGGVTPAPGLYALGLSFMRRRSSSFIDGVGRDAEALAHDIVRHLAGARLAA